MEDRNIPIRYHCSSCGNISEHTPLDIQTKGDDCKKCNRGKLRPYMTGWILQNSASDINYKHAVKRLTANELKFCLMNDSRKTGIRQLEREQRRRKT